MEDKRKINSGFETVAWGAFFVLWGITEMFDFLPKGMGAVGIGLIFISLNLARMGKGLPTSGFTTTLGIIALVLGGLELVTPWLHLSFEIPMFAILLVAVGVSLLVRQMKANAIQ